METSPGESFEEKRLEVTRRLKRRLKTARKSYLQLEEEFARANNWHTLYREGILLQSNLYRIPPGAERVEFEDWETNQIVSIALDKKTPIHEQIASKLKRSKKYERGIPHLQRQIGEMSRWIERIEEAIASIDQIATIEELLVLAEPFVPQSAKKESHQSVKVRLPYKEYVSPTGILIWVGKGARDNDRLTFTYAKGMDWWLHVDGYSGSHVVIRTDKGEFPDEETVALALQLAIAASKAPKISKVEVCFTQVKHLRKLKGQQPGTVRLTEHKKLLAAFDPRWSTLRPLP